MNDTHTRMVIWGLIRKLSSKKQSGFNIGHNKWKTKTKTKHFSVIKKNKLNELKGQKVIKNVGSS